MSILSLVGGANLAVLELLKQAENGQVGTTRKAQNTERGQGFGVLKTYISPENYKSQQ